MILFLTTALSVILNAVLAAVVLLRKRHSLTNQLVSLFIALLALWAVTNYLATTQPVFERLFWVHTVMAITIPLPVLALLIAYIFPNNDERIPQKVIIFATFSTFITIFFAFTPWMFSSYDLMNGIPVLTAGPAIYLYGFVFVTTLLLSMWKFWQRYKSTSGQKKAQLKIILLALIGTISLGFCTNFIGVVVFKTLDLVPLGPLFSFILTISFTYAIVHHRLWDIRIIIFRSVSYLLFVTLLSVVYVFGIFFLGQRIQGNLSSGVAFGIACAVFASVTFPLLKHRIDYITAKILYRNNSSLSSMQLELGDVMTRSLDLKTVQKEFSEILKTNLLTEFAEFIFRVPSQSSANDDAVQKIAEKLKKSLQKSNQKVLLREELPEHELQVWLANHHVAVVVNCSFGDKGYVVLLLGDKSNGEAFTVQELNILKLLSAPLSVSLKNAFAYAKIHTFNQVLKKEVALATRQLRQANRRLQKLDQLKDEFVSIASHELRTPMSAIQSSLWLAQNQKDHPLPPKANHYITLAYQATDRLLRMVKEILTISQIETQRLIMKFQLININQELTDLTEQWMPAFQKKEVKLILELPTKEVQMNGDNFWLREVWQNILNNAWKFTPLGGAVTIKLITVGSSISVFFSDTGSGMSKEDQAELFTKFSRIGQSYARRNDSGSGLGLYIADQIVKLHQGAIIVKSEKNKGTSFQIQLPVNQGKKT